MTGADAENLHQTVVRAALPLLGEYETLTTARIARAANVGEAELLTVFADTEAVMRACATALSERIAAVLDPAGEVRQLAAIRPDQPLAARLTEVVGVLDAYARRIRAGLDDLQPVAGPPLIPPDELRSHGGDSAELRRAVARVLEPDELLLRLPAPALADAFVAMAVGGVRPAERIVDLFLHGALHAA